MPKSPFLVSQVIAVAVITASALSAHAQQYTNISNSGMITPVHTVNGGCNSCQQPQRCIRCPRCLDDGVCQLVTKQGKVEKKCYKIDSKKICIPAVRLPWQQCESKCGRARTVKVLTKKKYECNACEYEWEVVEAQTIPYEESSQDSPSDVPTIAAPSAPQASVAPGILTPYLMPHRIRQSAPAIVQPSSTRSKLIPILKSPN